MKKRAEIADSLNCQIDRQIKELAQGENVEASLTPNTSAPGGNLSQTESAILSLDHDLMMLLLMVGNIKHQVEMFETFIRSMSSEMTKLKNSLKK